MQSRNMEKQKKQFAILKAKGMLLKDIAKEIGVSSTTVGEWNKTLPLPVYLTIRDGMQKRLAAMLKNPQTPVMDIYNLSNALTGIQKMIDKYTNAANKATESKESVIKT